MTILSKAICWAAAMLIIAAGTSLEFLDRGAGTTLLFVMPILAVTTMRNSNPCKGGVA